MLDKVLKFTFEVDTEKPYWLWLLPRLPIMLVVLVFVMLYLFVNKKNLQRSIPYVK